MYNLEWLKNNRQFILFEIIYGSHAYNTATETSDVDHRGVYILPEEAYYALDYVPQIGDDKNDTVYYELKEFGQLLSESKTTVLEMLHIPKDCIVYVNPIFEKYFISNKDEFLTKDLIKSFVSMSFAQIKKASGTNKKMNYEKDRITRKTPLDFCYVPYKQGSKPLTEWLAENNFTQENCGLVNVPNMRDGYALFYSTEHNYRGIIRKESSNDICLSSIPKGEKSLTFVQFNKDAYTIHCKDYREYLEWLEKRNTNRYVDVKNHNQKLDGKNLLHCVRVLETAKEFIETGIYNVRRTNRNELLDIKLGNVTLEKIVEKSMADIDFINNKIKEIDIKDKADINFLNKLLYNTRKEYY